MPEKQKYIAARSAAYHHYTSLADFYLMLALILFLIVGFSKFLYNTTLYISHFYLLIAISRASYASPLISSSNKTIRIKIISPTFIRLLTAFSSSTHTFLAKGNAEYRSLLSIFTDAYSAISLQISHEL